MVRSPSTIGRWRKLCVTMMLAALPIGVASGTVTGFSVIHSLTRASLVWTLPATVARRSRSVRIPTSRPKSVSRSGKQMTISDRTHANISLTNGKKGLAWPEWRSEAGDKVRKCGRGG
jgi:FtsP/CotA-like multicopper oxidase with cupredoxin domain